MYPAIILLISELAACLCQNTTSDQEIPITSAPYQVSLQLFNRNHILWEHLCSGAIITQWHVVTAAHCTTAPEPWLRIRAGSAKWYDGGLVVGIRKVLVNPKYNSSTDYDVSVVKLTNALPLYTPEICPIAWARAWPKGTEALLSGWGEFPVTLLGRNVTLIDKERCARAKGYAKRLNKRMVCSDSCVGESGGPLVMKGVLVGLFSWRTKGACGEDIPSVFSNLAAYREFIEYAVTAI